MPGTCPRDGPPLVHANSVPGASPTNRESRVFPEFFARGLSGFGQASRPANAPTPPPQGVFCVGPLTYIGQDEYKRDIQWIKDAAKGQQVEELCLTALAPATIEHWMRTS